MSLTLPRLRIDQALVTRGLVPTRSRARDLIYRGLVEVDGVTATKPAQMVRTEDRVNLKIVHADYVSRGAHKLAAALEHFAFDAVGRTALDIGASTGGFTETLLLAGASKVYAVDNGQGQLHARLQSDPRVVSLEGMDARRLDRSMIPEPIDALVADVSFISLTKALTAAMSFTRQGCWLAVLVKPQFEAAPGVVPRDGIVKDTAIQAAAVERVATWLGNVGGWRLYDSIPSPIHGGDGNIEFLIGAEREH